MWYDVIKLNICLQINMKYTVLSYPIVVMELHCIAPPPPHMNESPLRSGAHSNSASPPLAEKWIENPASTPSIRQVDNEETKVGLSKATPTSQVKVSI